MSFRFFCSSMFLRISVSTPTSKAACIPPPWQPTATFFGPSAFSLLDLTIVRPLLPCAWLTRNQTTSRRVLHFCPGAPRHARAHPCHHDLVLPYREESNVDFTRSITPRGSEP